MSNRRGDCAGRCLIMHVCNEVTRMQCCQVCARLHCWCGVDGVADGLYHTCYTSAIMCFMDIAGVETA
jgi:hypothetical protein